MKTTAELTAEIEKCQSRRASLLEVTFPDDFWGHMDEVQNAQAISALDARIKMLTDRLAGIVEWTPTEAQVRLMEYVCSPAYDND